MKKVVLASSFLKWYGWMDKEKHSFMSKLIDNLSSDGKIVLKIEDIYKNVSYIPEYICVNGDQLSDVEYNPTDVLLINDLKD